MEEFGTTTDGYRLYYGGVCSRTDLIEEHINKHGLGIDASEYLLIADISLDSFSHSGKTRLAHYKGKMYRVVLDGDVEYQDKKYAVVRSVVRKNRLTARRAMSFLEYAE